MMRSLNSSRAAFLLPGVLALLLPTLPLQAQTPLPESLTGVRRELRSPNPELYGEFGNAVAGVADVDGDGRGDLLVGAFGEDRGRRLVDAGRAYVFSGATGALLRTLVSPNGEAYGDFGWSAAGAPDVDGDGRGDVVVGALYEDPGASPDGTGRVYVFSGSTGALLHTLASPNEQMTGNFGWSVSGVPDVNGDGRGDLLVGAWRETPRGGPDEAGRAYVFSGATGALLHTLVSPNGSVLGRFGTSVAGVPDVDGDGRGDVVVGTYSEGTSPDGGGRAYVFSGATGLLLHTLASPNEEPFGNFGWSVTGVSDVNGDGRGDVAVGTPYEDPGPSPEGAGRAYVFSGSTGALLRTLVSPNEEANGAFGYAVTGVADVDGDGRGDLLVGGAGQSPGGSPDDAGRAYLFSGATGARLRTLASPNQEEGGSFGSAIAAVPDVDGDGRADFLVGALGEAPGTSPNNAGRAYVISSSPSATAATPASARGAEGRADALVSPNPAVDGAAVAFTLEAPGVVRLALYDALGRAVASVEGGRLEAGPHRLALDVSSLPGGVYVWRLLAGGATETGRLTVLR